jgi:NAD(P)-dependent dehydrogenase (short-subunit alcohol dehydrogenase family)
VDPIRKIKRADLLPDLAPPSSDVEADVNGLRIVQEAHQRIDQVNVVATSMVLTAFLPMLQLTSPSPSINLLSSTAAYIPAPTRPLYGSSKAAQLILFQSVGIEAASQAKASTTPKRNKVNFHAVVPGTILSDFRQSAVDGSVESSGAIDDTWKDDGKGNKSGGDGLTTSYVADRCIWAVDRFQEGVDELPTKYWLARRLLPFL